MSNLPRVTDLVADQNLIDGLTKHQATIGSIVIASKTYTVAAAIALIQTSLTASKNVVVQHSSLDAALLVEETTRTANQPFVSGLKQTLQVMFAGQVDALADFGLKGRKPRVVSPQTLVAAAAKARATRAARGTKGPRARLAIKAVATPVADPQTAVAPATATPPSAAAIPVATPAPRS